MIRTVIIGGGNVAFQLTENLLNNENISLIQVINRTVGAISYLKDTVSISDNFLNLLEADLYLIAVSDNAIAEVSRKLNVNNKLIVHTSGATSINSLPDTNTKGVFYLPQTFSRNKLIDLSTVPACIDASTDEGFDLLKRFTQAITTDIRRLNDEQRCHLHAAAVFVNNFVNHLYMHGMDICEAGGVDFEILQPLIQETAKKIVGLKPLDIQTGPAMRNDIETFKKHGKVLNEAQQDLYTILSKSILRTYDKKL